MEVLFRGGFVLSAGELFSRISLDTPAVSDPGRITGNESDSHLH